MEKIVYKVLGFIVNSTMDFILFIKEKYETLHIQRRRR